MSAFGDQLMTVLLLGGCAVAVLVPSAALAWLIGRAVAGRSDSAVAFIVGVVVFLVSAAGIAWLILYAMCSGMKL